MSQIFHGHLIESDFQVKNKYYLLPLFLLKIYPKYCIRHTYI